MRTVAFLLLLGSALGLLSCRELGLPHAALQVASRDGQTVAEVLDRPSLDPPRQALALRAARGESIIVRELAEDQEWCDTVVWSPDGRRVAFLVRGIEIDVYDAASARRLLRERPTRTDTGHWSVRELEFTRGGEGLAFRICDGRTGACDPPVIRPIPGAAG